MESENASKYFSDEDKSSTKYLEGRWSFMSILDRSTTNVTNLYLWIGLMISWLTKKTSNTIGYVIVWFPLRQRGPNTDTPGIRYHQSRYPISRYPASKAPKAPHLTEQYRVSRWGCEGIRPNHLKAPVLIEIQTDTLSGVCVPEISIPSASVLWHHSIFANNLRPTHDALNADVSKRTLNWWHWFLKSIMTDIYYEENDTALVDDWSW